MHLIINWLQKLRMEAYILAYIRRKHYLINCVALPDLILNLCLQCFGDTHTYLMTYTVCFQLLRQIS